MPAKFCDFGELYLYEFCQITFKLCNFTDFKVLLPLVLMDFPNLSPTTVEKTVKGCITRRCCYRADVVAIAGMGWLISDSRVCSKEN